MSRYIILQLDYGSVVSAIFSGCLNIIHVFFRQV